MLFMPPFSHSSSVTVPLASTSMAVIMSFSTCANTISHSFIIRERFIKQIRTPERWSRCFPFKKQEGKNFLTVLSSVTSQPRQSAARIICVIIRSTSQRAEYNLHSQWTLVQVFSTLVTYCPVRMAKCHDKVFKRDFRYYLFFNIRYGNIVQTPNFR